MTRAHAFAIIAFLGCSIIGIGHAQTVIVAPSAPGTTTVYNVNGQTITARREALPAVPYRETYPGRKFNFWQSLLFGDPQIKIDCRQGINWPDPRCKDERRAASK